MKPLSDIEAGSSIGRTSKRVSTEDARAISAELLSAVMSLIPDASVIADVEGRIVSVNEQAEDLFGYAPGSLAGLSVESLIPERVRRRHRLHREEFSADPQSRPMGAGLELTGRRRDGSEFPIDISLAPIVSGGEQLVIAAIRDATEQRKASAVQAELATIVRSSFDAIISTTLDGRITNWNPAAEDLLGFRPDEILGQHVTALVPNHALPVLEELLEAASESRYREALLTRWRHRGGYEVDASVSISPLKDQGPVIQGFCYVIRDNTERKKSEDDLRRMLEEEERLQRQHAMASEIRLVLLSDAPLSESLTFICQRACEFVGAAVTVICVKSSDGVRIVAGAGLDAELVGKSMPLGLSFAERVIDGGVPLEIAQRSEYSQVEVPEGFPDGPTFGVPIIVGGSVMASLTFVRAPGGPGFDTNMRLFAEALSAQAGLAFEIGRAQRGRAQMMLVEDRERIARDLHDHVIQRLFAAGLGLQASLSWVSEPTALDRISEAVDVLDETIREIRNTIFSLSTPNGGGQLLRSQIEAAVRQSRTSLGFAPSLELDGLSDEGVPNDLAPHVIACVREALSNVARHAQASTAQVQLKVVGGVLQLTVSDDGVGIGSTTRSSGLANLRERAQLLSGTFEVSSGGTGGTRLVWTVPIID